jgi:hypothetical protein
LNQRKNRENQGDNVENEDISLRLCELRAAYCEDSKMPGLYQPYKPGFLGVKSAAVCCPTALQANVSFSHALLLLKAGRVKVNHHHAD